MRRHHGKSGRHLLMKTCAASLAAATLIAGPFAVQAAEFAGSVDKDFMQGDGAIGTARVESYMNIRQEPGTDSGIVGYLFRGNGAQVIGRQDDWYHVVTGEMTGWVRDDYFITGSEADDFLEGVNPRVATVNAEYLNVRSEPGTDAAIIGGTGSGAQFSVLGQEGNWLKVRYTTTAVGYICADYCSVDEGLSVGVTAYRNQVRQGQKVEAPAASAGAEVNEEGAPVEVVDTDEENTVQESSQDSDDGWVSLGTFKITAYCPCTACNGNSSGLAANGEPLEVGTTVAVSRSVIPLNKEIKIEGISGTRIAQDTGVSGRTIDLLLGSHSETNEFGVQYREVWIRE